MRSVVIVSGVLGVGTAVVFALAAVAASMFPDGGSVMSGWNGGGRDFGMRAGPIAVPQPIVVGQGSGGMEITVPDSPPPN
jgi:hypothetical protein